MTDTKKLPLVLTVMGLGAMAAQADIKINDNLTTTGFIDMSLNGMAPDKGPGTLNASLDQYELDFLYKFGPVSARADINGTPSFVSPGAPAAADTTGWNSSGIYLEQAYVTANLGALAIGAGRFLSSSGWEAAEPTGMYQYSYSKNLFYGYYQNGVNLSYTMPKFALYGAVVSDLWNPQEFDVKKTPGFEGQVALTPVEGVTAKIAYLYQMFDKDVSGKDDQQLLNAWASYAKGSLTLAAEYNLLIDWDATKAGGKLDDDGNGWLAMVNYKFTPLFATTVRYSGNKIGDLDADTEITLSPSFQVSPNWLVLAEGKYEIDLKNVDYAIESTFSF
jgi:hypothetical protein